MKRIISAFLCITMLFGCSNPTKEAYNQAKKDLESGEYANARKAFKELEGYQDSHDLYIEATYQLALKKGGSRAVELFDECDGYKDSDERAISECKKRLNSMSIRDYLQHDDPIVIFLKQKVGEGNVEAIEIYDEATQMRIRSLNPYDRAPEKNRPCDNKPGFGFTIETKIPIILNDVSYSITLDDGGSLSGYLGTLTTGEKTLINEMSTFHYTGSASFVHNGKPSSHPNEGDDCLIIGGLTFFSFPDDDAYTCYDAKGNDIAGREVNATYTFYDAEGNVIYQFHV